MMCLFASEFTWTPKSLFQGFPKSLASETWSFSQPWSKDQYFLNVFFSTGAHISRESLHRTQINEIGKFPAAIIEAGLGVPETPHLWAAKVHLIQSLSVTKKETEAQWHAYTHSASEWLRQDWTASPDSQPDALSRQWAAPQEDCFFSRCVHALSVSMNFLPKLGDFHRCLSSGSEVNSCSHLCWKHPGSWGTEVSHKGGQQVLGMGALPMRRQAAVSAHSATQLLPFLFPVTVVQTSPWELACWFCKQRNTTSWR